MPWLLFCFSFCLFFIFCCYFLQKVYVYFRIQLSHFKNREGRVFLFIELFAFSSLCRQHCIDLTFIFMGETMVNIITPKYVNALTFSGFCFSCCCFCFVFLIVCLFFGNISFFFTCYQMLPKKAFDVSN